jgi:leucyl-tRNA synthetase
MTLAPEHELVAKITTQNRKQLLKLTLKELQNVPKRRMADVKTISGVSGAYAEILLPKSQFRFDWDYVFAGYGTGAVMAVPCGDERDYAFANFFKGQAECGNKNIFLMLIFRKKPTVLKIT